MLSAAFVVLLCGNDILTATRAFIMIRYYDITTTEIHSYCSERCKAGHSTRWRRAARRVSVHVPLPHATSARRFFPPKFLRGPRPANPDACRKGIQVLVDHTCPSTAAPKPRILHIHRDLLLTTRSTTLARSGLCTATRYQAYQTCRRPEHTYLGYKAVLLSLAILHTQPV